MVSSSLRKHYIIYPTDYDPSPPRMSTLLDTAGRSTRCIVSIVALLLRQPCCPRHHNALSFPSDLGGVSCLESELAASCKP